MIKGKNYFNNLANEWLGGKTPLIVDFFNHKYWQRGTDNVGMEMGNITNT